MRRSFGLMLDAATILSLVLSVATVTVWVRRYLVAETFVWHADGDPARPRYAYWFRGRLGLIVARETMTAADMRRMNLLPLSPPPPGIQYARAVADARRPRPDDLDRSWVL